MSHFCRSGNVKIQRNFKNKILIKRKYMKMKYSTELTRISKRRLCIVTQILFLFTGYFENLGSMRVLFEITMLVGNTHFENVE